MITYKKAFDKITEAYIKDEIKPMDRNTCFCGTLGWNTGNDYYTRYDYKKMEWALLRRLIGIYTDLVYLTPPQINIYGFQWVFCEGVKEGVEPKTKEYEDALFRGLCDALDVLKKIHIERGENVDGIQLVKREAISI